ncbi:MAG: hypothetical protein EA381_13090 [Planctomycetaceae bacterium]|nr:MAG: hypothetical protein EA381_13090 [Planctomycetaceae bacterium]
MVPGLGHALCLIAAHQSLAGPPAGAVGTHNATLGCEQSQPDCYCPVNHVRRFRYRDRNPPVQRIDNPRVLRPMGTAESVPTGPWAGRGGSS